MERRTFRDEEARSTLRAERATSPPVPRRYAMSTTWLLAVALALLAFADPDEQPECLARCEGAYEAALQQCEALGSEDSIRAQECGDAAKDRRQDCVDGCLD
jgi:hypothetical protein